MVWAIIIILLVAADQLLKMQIRVNIGADTRITVIDNFFYIVNRRNRGAAWSFLAGKDWGLYALAAISAVITIVVLIILYRSRNKRLQACLTFICAGSIGNLIDRVFHGGVTDYLDFHFGSYVFPTYNLADMMIVCGTIALCLLILFDRSLQRSAAAEPGAEPGAEKKEEPHAADHSD